MTKQNNPNFTALEINIIDVIKEEQIKLGYKSETIRLYYPMESINNLLGVEYSLTEVKGILDQFCEFVNTRLGNVTHSNVNERFCLTIPPNGVTYVHEKVEDRYFLRELIEKISGHNCTLDEILDVFHRHSDNVICNKVSNGEFDYLVYFEDGNPDFYMYCLKFEDCHVVYHRFTKDDYEKFNF
jgi:hypothetical protein